jgi:hypothetical protein
MKATFKNFKLLADKELYEAMVKKYGVQSYGDRIAIKTNNSFASWMIAEEIGDKYRIVPLTSQNNERQSLQMEAYWTVLKEFPINEWNDVPQFYKQWFVNRGLMKEGIQLNEKKTTDVIQYDLEPGLTLYYKRPDEGQEKTFMFTDKKLQKVYKRKGSTIIFPMKDIYGVSKYSGGKHYKSEKVVGQISEEKERDYKDEYKKFQSSKKSKKYRAELNKYNRDKGTYGNGDGKDASHKGGKISGFEDESTNKGRREKSRIKKESRMTKTRLREIIIEEYQKLTEIMIPKDIEAEIKKSISMGFNRIQTGMISPKRKGIMLVNKKNQVRGTYDLKLKNAIQSFIDKKLKEGTVNHPDEIVVYDGKDGSTYISKRGKGYYGYNNNFDFEAKNKKELLDKLKRWGYKLMAGKI